MDFDRMNEFATRLIEAMAHRLGSEDSRLIMQDFVKSLDPGAAFNAMTDFAMLLAYRAADVQVPWELGDPNRTVTEEKVKWIADLFVLAFPHRQAVLDALNDGAKDDNQDMTTLTEEVDSNE